MWDWSVLGNRVVGLGLGELTGLLVDVRLVAYLFSPSIFSFPPLHTQLSTHPFCVFQGLGLVERMQCVGWVTHCLVHSTRRSGSPSDVTMNGAC